MKALVPTLVCALAYAVPAAADTGNAWHLPQSAEVGEPTMRAPLRGVGPMTVAVMSGNQFQGAGGNPGNQLQNGSAVLYRLAGTSEWAEAAMTFHSQQGNNKYYSASFAIQSPGDLVEYYLRIPYGDHDTTFVFGTDETSQTTASEAIAQAAPFRIAAEHPLEPAGDAVTTGRTGYLASVYESSGHVRIAGAASEIVVGPAAVFSGGAWLPLGQVTSSASGSDGQLDLTQRVGATEITSRLSWVGDGAVRYEVIDWGGLTVDEVELSAASDDSERFYGLGEKFNALDQSEKITQILARDAPGDKGDRSYKAVPWFVSSRGYGLWFDSDAVSEIDFRATDSTRLTIRHREQRLAYTLILGPELTDVLERYTALTGRPPLPPTWAFAPWLSSDIWRDGGEVRYVVQTYRQLGLPGSVFVFDSPWETAYNDFSWNMSQFGAGGTYDGVSYDGFESLAEMMSFLDQNGFKVVVWLTPFINVSSVDEGVPGQNLGKPSVYDEAEQAGYFVRSSPGGPPLVVPWWKGLGSPIDFTNPDARAWFQGKLADLVTESGGVIGGFKADDGESDFIPDTAAYFDGRRGTEMKNAFSVAYHFAVYSVLESDGVLFSRSGFTGTQAFPACWAGDNEPNFGRENGLPSVVIAGLSAAMSGYSIWGHDIGGYQETNPSQTPEDLFRRWTQFGALSPIMQIHRQVAGNQQYPWSYGDDALANYRRYAELHTALFPYLYTLADESSRTGAPILRPLVLHYQDDPLSQVIDDQYLVGDALLVAPVLTGGVTAREVYLPAGSWFDWLTSERIAGGQTITWQGDGPHDLPMFARAGAIVPMLGERVDSLVGENSAGPLDVRFYPSGDSSLRLFDDTVLASAVGDESITASITGDARTVTFRVLADPPRVAELDGVEVDFEVETGAVIVTFDHAGATSSLELSYAEPDGGPDGPPGSGCACDSARSSGFSGPGGAGLLVLLLLGATRRRRRGRCQ